MPNTAPTPNTTRFILIRHGESNVMVDGVVGGPKTCSGLSPKGRRQAELLGKRFEVGNEPSFDVVYSSPLPRALETTHILLGTNPLDLEINIHPDLEEFRLGEADGLTWDQVRESYSAVSRRVTTVQPSSSVAMEVSYLRQWQSPLA